MKSNIRLTMTALLLTFAVAASARFNAAKTDAPPVYFGLRAGVGASLYTNIDDPVALATPIGGIALGFKVAKMPLYLELSALYMNMGSKVKAWESRHYRRYDDHHFGTSSDSWQKADRFTIDNHSVMVPIVATYRFYANDHITIEPFTGLYGSYGFGNKRVDFGLREGAAFGFGVLYVNVGVNVGLVGQNRVEKDYWLQDGQHGSLFLGVGLNF